MKDKIDEWIEKLSAGYSPDPSEQKEIQQLRSAFFEFKKLQNNDEDFLEALKKRCEEEGVFEQSVVDPSEHMFALAAADGSEATRLASNDGLFSLEFREVEGANTRLLVFTCKESEVFRFIGRTVEVENPNLVVGIVDEHGIAKCEVGLTVKFSENTRINLTG